MDETTLVETRRSLHGVAELLLAGPQFVESDDIRLRVTPGGFGSVAAPGLRVDGVRLVGTSVDVPLEGSFAELAEAAGVEARELRDVYDVGPGVSPGDPVRVDPEACATILRAFADADDALRAFAPDEEPVLWPEHFDIGISLAEVNYGVSPGDDHLAVPYAYVGPWQPRSGPFWNVSFGAAHPLTELGGAAAIENFFREGAEAAAADPPRSE